MERTIYWPENRFRIQLSFRNAYEQRTANRLSECDFPWNTYHQRHHLSKQCTLRHLWRVLWNGKRWKIFYNKRLKTRSCNAAGRSSRRERFFRTKTHFSNNVSSSCSVLVNLEFQINECKFTEITYSLFTFYQKKTALSTIPLILLNNSRINLIYIKMNGKNYILTREPISDSTIFSERLWTKNC